MDLTCTVEGVETREQLDSLRQLGCDLIQGYLFAKPMPAEAVADFLADEGERLGGGMAAAVAG
jgi:EAL domain-containing protein (putative c-di-GMP-specific phosphodiesterase class I)